MASEFPVDLETMLPDGDDPRVASEEGDPGPQDTINDSIREEANVSSEESEDVGFRYKIVDEAEMSSLLDDPEFQIPTAEFERARAAFLSGRRSKDLLWTYQMYRDAIKSEVGVDYCTNWEQSEKVAEHFLQERVLGLKMKWAPQEFGDKVDYNDIKKSASLIMLASEKRIGLFHIARHEGDTVEQLLAPTLKQILESADIVKTGVCILTCENDRLVKCFKIKPQGLMELSHLYNLIGCTNPEPGARICKRAVNLQQQVEEHLLLPFYLEPRDPNNYGKSGDRTDWSVSHLSDGQKHYATRNAYALYQLFRVMDEKRRKLRPVPPLPEFAECRKDMRHADEFYQARLQFKAKKRPHKTTTGEKQKDTDTTQEAQEQESASVDPQADAGAGRSAQSLPTENQPEVQSYDAAETAPEAIGTVEEQTTQEGPVQESSPVPMQVDPPTQIDAETLSSILLSSLKAERKSILDEITGEPRPKDGPTNSTIAHNDDLACLAQERPTELDSVYRMEGIGENAKRYAANWVRVIEKHNQQAPFSTLYIQILASLTAARNEMARLRRFKNNDKVIEESVLQSMAFERPRNRDALLRVRGIGPVKARCYGDTWLQIIERHCYEAESAARDTFDEPTLTQTQPAPITPPRNSQRVPSRSLVNSPEASRLSSQMSGLHTSDQTPAAPEPPAPETPEAQTGRVGNTTSASSSEKKRNFTMMIENDNGEWERFSGTMTRDEEQPSNPSINKNTRRKLFQRDHQS